MMKRKALTTPLAAVAIAMLTASAFATSVIPVNLAHLVEWADKAFVGTVESVEVVQVGNIWTDQVTVTVSEAVLGDVQAGDTVTWNQVRNTETVPMPSMPQFAVGGEYLIFLAAESGDSPYTAPVALDQGAFTITEDSVSGQPVAVNAHGNSSLWDGLNTAAIRLEAGAAESQLDGLIRAAQLLDTVENPQEAFAAPEGQELSATIVP